MESSTPITLDYTKSGVNGVDGGSIQPSKVYAVYVVTCSDGTLPAYGLMSTVQSLATGSSPKVQSINGKALDAKRCIGYFVTDPFGVPIRCTTIGSGNERIMSLEVDTLNNVILFNWRNSTATKTVPLVNFVPSAPGVNVGIVVQLQAGTNSQNVAWLSNKFNSSLTNNYPIYDAGASGIRLSEYIDIAVDYTTGAPNLYVQLGVTSQEMDMQIYQITFSV
jgi:hypothetical protein